MKTTSSLMGCLLFCALPVFSQKAPAVADSGNASGSDEPSVSFLVPAEGDINYSTELKVLARVEGADIADLLPVVDGYSGGDSLSFVQDDVVALNLTGLAQGLHELRILYIDSGEVVSTPAVHFFVRTSGPERDTTVAVKSAWVQSWHVTAQAEYRGRAAASPIVNQSQLQGLKTVEVPETDTTYAYDTLALVAGKGEAPLSKNIDAVSEITYNIKNGRFEGSFDGLVSSDENRFRQTADRLSAALAYGPWAYVKGGDVYPNYNPLILNGTRIRGGEAGAALVTGDSGTQWAYVKIASGESQREVPAYAVESDAAGGGTELEYVPGSYSQNITTLRVGVGGGQSFDLGVTLMKTTESKGDSLFEDLDQYLNGPRPSQNLVGGVDTRLGLWNGRVQVYGQWAVSLFTRDESLGAFSVDTSGSGFDPAKYKNIIVINPTTQGWQYLLTQNAGSKPDVKGFVNANSTYITGVSSSVPFSKCVWETDASYSHTGSEYHSEGNPSLGGNAVDGWDVQQRLALLENRLHLGAEASNFIQDLIDYTQMTRSFKGNIQISPGGYSPTFWANGTVTSQFPRGAAPNGYTQDYDEANVGGMYAGVVGPGMWNFSTQYGYAYSEYTLHPTDINLPPVFYPFVRTQSISTSTQYKIRDTELQPKISHTYSDNGVQRPTNNGTLGVLDAFFSKRFSTDADFLMGQYAKTNTRNGLSFGENLTLALTLSGKQSVRGYEKWSKYGNTISIISGGNYEIFF